MSAGPGAIGIQDHVALPLNLNHLGGSKRRLVNVNRAVQSDLLATRRAAGRPRGVEQD
jgi:hypothetical protein